LQNAQADGLGIRAFRVWDFLKIRTGVPGSRSRVTHCQIANQLHDV
jgi:hypothetical protein